MFSSVWLGIGGGGCSLSMEHLLVYLLVLGKEAFIIRIALNPKPAQEKPQSLVLDRTGRTLTAKPPKDNWSHWSLTFGHAHAKHRLAYLDSRCFDVGL